MTQSEIEEREAARAERGFHLAADHPQRKHVERDVREISVQKSVREDLPRLECHAHEAAIVELRHLRLAQRPQREMREHAVAAGLLKHEYENVRDEQRRGDGRHFGHGQGLRRVILAAMMPDPALPAHVAPDLERSGYCVVENFLEANAIAALALECRSMHEREELRPRQSGAPKDYNIDASIRGDHTRWFDPAQLTPAQATYWTSMDALRISLNRLLLLALDEIEAHYALYPPGARYARHRDRFRDDDARVLSSVLYLNRTWRKADGGALRIYVGEAAGASEPESHVDIAPHAGTLVLFLSADFEHEVLPAARERMSVAGWFRRSR